MDFSRVKLSITENGNWEGKVVLPNLRILGILVVTLELCANGSIVLTLGD
jgi:hypothetical protein